MKKEDVHEGMMVNKWLVLKTNLVNPNTNHKLKIGKPIFAYCRCTQCNQTEMYICNWDLGKTKMCNSCSGKQNAANKRTIKIGDKFGYLEVVQDGGTDGLRHYSLCKCTHCNREDLIKVMDIKLLTGNNVSCGCITSKGEEKIKDILNNNHIKYDYNKSYPPLIEETSRKLRFDFIIYNNDNSINRFIEFDGNQHKTGMWGGNWSNLETFDVIHERDLIKNDFCIKHDYVLIRIPYWKINTLTIEDIMTDKFRVIESGKNNG